jgi:protein-S-isoprenylcysteine O-methyltransferase Ste14
MKQLLQVSLPSSPSPPRHVLSRHFLYSIRPSLSFSFLFVVCFLFLFLLFVMFLGGLSCLLSVFSTVSAVEDRRLEIVTAQSEEYMRVRVAVLRTRVHNCAVRRGTTPWRVHWPVDEGDDSLVVHGVDAVGRATLAYQ